MKIAICLSGQPRTVKYTGESILNYFSGNYEIDYFVHSWDYNTWKIKDDQRISWSEDEHTSYKELVSSFQIFNPKKIKIQSAENYPKKGPWHSLFYSMMIANNLKKQYEIENDFRYDIVVRCRPDLIFSPNSKFEVNSPNQLIDLNLFTSHSERMPQEYKRRNVSDVIFYGTSYTLDIVCDVYRYNDIEFKRDYQDFELLGPGVIINQYCNQHNIIIYPGNITEETIYRKEMIPLNSLTDYDTIEKNNRRYYL